VKTGEVLAELKRVQQLYNLPKVTSGSFRRYFEQQAIAACKGDFREAAFWHTLHNNWKILAAHYDKD
jgi:hypothetical protein